MAKLLKEYTVHIGLVTAIALLLSVLAFGRSAGEYEAEFEEVKETVEEHEIKLEEVPVLRTNQEIIINNQKEMREDIKTLIKRK